MPRRIGAPLTCPSTPPDVPSKAIEQLEPLFPSGRNLFFHETGELISFIPYRPLPSVPAFATHAAALRAGGARRVLIDVGANGFFASPKRLIDLYEHSLPFTDVVLIEPDDLGMTVPAEYSRKMSIRFEKRYVNVGTRDVSDDLLSWLPSQVKPEDYVVLKFDVDEGTDGSTIEWGFLSDLCVGPALLCAHPSV
jgi:hypothetical protein